MSRQVLILQSDPKSSEYLAKYFSELESNVWQATSPSEAQAILTDHKPELAVVDLHLLENGWIDLIPHIQQELPDTKVLFTTNYPDPQREMQAKRDYRARTILCAPFSRTGIEQALLDLEEEKPSPADTKTDLPKVRVPVRLKITLPYVILALVLALAAAYIVSQVIVDTIEERFTNQLIEAGKLTSDWLVNEQDRLLGTLRLLSYTQGMPEAVGASDTDRLRQIALPLAINSQEEAIEILDLQGTSLLSLRHRRTGNLEDYEATQGENRFNQWTFVQDVLQGRLDQGRDKYAGVARAPWGDYLYVSGPIRDDQGNLVGVVLVGKSLPTLVRQIRQDTLAHITIYDLKGEPIASTFPSVDQGAIVLKRDDVIAVLERQNDASLIRPLRLASIDYSEIVGPLEIREFSGSVTTPRTNNDVGVLGVSLAETFIARPGQITRLQIFVLTTATFLLIIALGVYVANRITQPLLRMVTASAEVAQGNLDVQVDAKGDDEVAVLAHSFNEMVSGLREGSIYRDLFGRTVSPEVREQLRRGFASGEVSLEGQDVMATILMSDIRDFTTLAESENPTKVLSWLNEYFEVLIPIIINHGGVVSNFEGDNVLVSFGILPRPLSAEEGAYRACQTAVAMLKAIEQFNARRAKRDEPPLRTGIAINTGPVTAGALGSADRLHYTVIGDTVNAAVRLENLTRQFSEENSALITQHTLFALRERRHEFALESMGVQNLKGKIEQLLVYRLSPSNATP